MWFGYILGTLAFEPYGTDIKAYQNDTQNTKKHKAIQD